MPSRRSFALALLLAARISWAGTLQVELSNLMPGRPVHVQLYGDGAAWEIAQPMAQQTIEAHASRQVVSFDQLQPGRYAVTAEQRGPGVRWLQSSPLRRGASGSSFGRRHPFGSASIEVKDDPVVRVRLVEVTQ